ncbi:hypothetical protein PIB30_037839 [Stylosanthes scabra]|uniref:Uncharacterized protein n=1 Tax=Stylosanthes scabra TaxID=79078 RepID=A0ABU6TE27_9FABA|nr:hypothetical protein [Stylosanthes scabra]
MEHEVQELRKENAKLRTVTRHLKSQPQPLLDVVPLSQSRSSRRAKTPPQKKITEGDVGPFVDIRKLEIEKRPFLLTVIPHGVASLCVTNGLINDDFIKQLTTKSVWSRKEMQFKAKEFIHYEEVNRVVAATKNSQAHTVPRGSGQTHNPRDSQRDFGFKGNRRSPKQKFDQYTPLVASITEIYH